MSIAEVAGPLDRRALLRAAILLVGGTAIAPDLLAASGRTFFNPAERATLTMLCDTMIPRTDTPGAVDAGVPAFLDGLMADYASAKTQASIRAIVARLGKAPATDRTAWLSRQDAALLAAGDADYRRFKQLVLTGYYYSEAGATQELRYELVPGMWEPSVPITADTRTWAA